MIARWWPRTLVGRTALVLLFGLVASNVVGVLVYSGERLDLLTSARGQAIAERIALIARVMAEAPPGERQQTLRSLRQPGMRVFWTRQPVAGAEASGWQAAPVRRALLKELGDHWSDRLRLGFGDHPGGPGMGGRGRGGPPAGGPGGLRGPPPDGPEDLPPGGDGEPRPARGVRRGEALVASLRLDDGSWINVLAPAAVFQPFWATPYFLIIVATTLMAAALSLWAVRRAARPLSMFAAAAERLGRDVHAPRLDEAGPLEVSRAASAFNQMQTRLQALLAERTQMLAAMSHDLRTPLTRLKLRAELIGDAEQQAKILGDVEEIRAMVDASLAFSRDEAMAEPAAALDFAVLVQTVCEEAEDAGQPVSYQGPAHTALVGRPQTLKRAIANLIDNAVKYGGRADVSLVDDADHIAVHVEDDGPGIDEAEQAKVFAPFYRVEGSRSRETGGVGLGLAVVAAAARVHGGAAGLANRPQGGLRATLSLPKRPTQPCAGD
jgi:signal transduction histidine kinase